MSSLICCSDSISYELTAEMKSVPLSLRYTSLLCITKNVTISQQQDEGNVIYLNEMDQAEEILSQVKNLKALNRPCGPVCVMALHLEISSLGH